MMAGGLAKRMEFKVTFHRCWLKNKEKITSLQPLLVNKRRDHEIIVVSLIIEQSNNCLESMSGEESEESIASPTTPLAPPPSFAPPKPAYLTPHHVIITQPTPEVESRAPIGEEENSADVEIKVETSENEENEPEDVMKEETDPSVVVINPDFTLEKPTRKYSDGNF